ncbi:hypothetical protein IWX50DRAFT_680327 [Phyllosticta citricarpa]|uniref:Uncharacterized protein n=1 Tax=Phyllosticta citricarpa TaxID=55181 RepID=A0ABR1MAH9_9PEZI
MRYHPPTVRPRLPSHHQAYLPPAPYLIWRTPNLPRLELPSRQTAHGHLARPTSISLVPITNPVRLSAFDTASWWTWSRSFASSGPISRPPRPVNEVSSYCRLLRPAGTQPIQNIVLVGLLSISSDTFVSFVRSPLLELLSSSPKQGARYSLPTVSRSHNLKMAERHTFRPNSRVTDSAPSALTRQVLRNRALSNTSQDTDKPDSYTNHWLETTPSPTANAVSSSAPPNVLTRPVAATPKSSSSSISDTTAPESEAASRLSQASTLVNEGPAPVYIGPDANDNAAATVASPSRDMSSSLAASLMRPLPPLPGDASAPAMPTRLPPPPPMAGGEMPTGRRMTCEYLPSLRETRGSKWEVTRHRFSRLMAVVRGEAREKREERRKANSRDMALKRRMGELRVHDEEAGNVY